MLFCKIRRIFYLFIFGVLTTSVFAQVQVEELSDNLLDAYGLEKSLPFTSWGSLPFDVLTEVTQDLASQKQSAVLANLTAAVLIQPTFIRETQWNKKQSQEWLILRLKSLVEMGHSDKALRMMEKLPASFVSMNVLKLQMDAYFLQENWQKACEIALQNSSKDVFISKVLYMAYVKKLF